jgi:hypothetical protein
MAQWREIIMIGVNGAC